MSELNINQLNWSSFNGLDILILLIIIISALFAFNKGLIKSIFSLAGWIGSIFFTYTLFPNIEPLLLKYMSNFSTLVFGYCGILIMFLIFFGIFNYIVIKSLFYKLQKGIIDKIFGLFFGAMRGTLIVVVLFICFSTIYNIFNNVDDETLNNQELVNSIINDMDETSNDDATDASGNKIKSNFVTKAMSYKFLIFGRDKLIQWLPADVRNNLKNINRLQNNIDSSNVKINVKNKNTIQNSNIKLITAIKTLSNYVDTEDLDSIKMQLTKENTEKMSEYDIGMYTLKLLLNSYKKDYTEGKIPANKALSHNDLIMIENLVEKNQ